jgi:hypothetical protein
MMSTVLAEFNQLATCRWLFSYHVRLAQASSATDFANY